MCKLVVDIKTQNVREQADLQKGNSYILEENSTEKPGDSSHHWNDSNTI